MNIEIRNKIESINAINSLGLNKFPEQLFQSNEEAKVQKFIDENPAKYYAIRDRSKAGGVFKLKVDSDKVLDERGEYTLFSINVSSINWL